jgi:hypothetical protein
MAIALISGIRIILINLSNVSSRKLTFMRPTLSNITKVSTFCHQGEPFLHWLTALKNVFWFLSR